MQLWCATLTPFRQGGSGPATVDLDHVRAHARWLLDRGVDALAPTGTTGEFLYLRPHERAEIHRATLEAADGAPVMPCVFDPDPGIMTDLARRAQDRGAWGVFSPPPIYQPVHADDIVAWYRRLVQSVQIPVYAYHHPRTHNPIDFPLLERLIEMGIAGMKDSSGDARRVRLLAQVFPGKIICGGDELLGAAGRVGPVGGHMSGLCNLRPRLCRELVDNQGRPADKQARQAERDRVIAAVAAAGRLPAMKHALGMGCRAPLTWFEPDAVAHVVAED